MNALIVFVGGGVGAVLRYGFGAAYLRLLGPERPYVSTFMINVVGSISMGLLVGLLSMFGGAGAGRWRLLIGVGVLGGFTTFSSFSLEVAMLIERKSYAEAAAYMIGSMALGVLGCFAGMWIVRRGLS
jgi:fluoride exporter